ncbi:MAG: threonine aldolase family protein [bacterium]
MATQQPSHRFFASDNASPVHPRILEAISQANSGHAVAYGEDPWTRRARQCISDLFGTDTETYFVFTGTGANVLAVAGAVPSYGAVVCTEMAHLYEDEAGAPEKFAGCKLLPAPCPDGKLRPEDVKALGTPGRVPHQSVPFMVSVTQSTEVGTLYNAEELTAICTVAHELGLLVHMDGARIANAAAAAALSRATSCDGAEGGSASAAPDTHSAAPSTEAAVTALREMTVQAGVDIISFGGTKNGLMFGEALIFLGPHARERSRALASLRKQGMQLAGKMRYIAAQFIPYLEEGIWVANAAHANAMAQRLSGGLADAGFAPAYPTQANGVFPVLPRRIVPALQERWPFYVWDEQSEVCRLMCSFDTDVEEVDAFIRAAREVIDAGGNP